MIDGYLLNMRVFNDVSDGEGQALKPLEEAAGVFGAWRKCDGMRYAATATREAFREDLIDGCVDAVQAIANLLAAVGATQGEVDAAVKRMDERNGDRGRLWEMEEEMAIEPPEGADGREVPLDAEAPCGGYGLEDDAATGHTPGGGGAACRHRDPAVAFPEKCERKGADHG